MPKSFHKNYFDSLMQTFTAEDMMILLSIAHCALFDKGMYRKVAKELDADDDTLKETGLVLDQYLYPSGHSKN